MRHSYNFYIVLTRMTRHNPLDVSRNMSWVVSPMVYFHDCISSYFDRWCFPKQNMKTEWNIYTMNSLNTMSYHKKMLFLNLRYNFIWFRNYSCIEIEWTIEDNEKSCWYGFRYLLFSYLISFDLMTSLTKVV